MGEHLHPEEICLLSEDGHMILVQFQKVAIEAPMKEISATCRGCGDLRPIIDCQIRWLETLLGRLQLKEFHGSSPAAITEVKNLKILKKPEEA